MKQKMSLEEKIVEYEPEICLEWKNLDNFNYFLLETKVTSNTTTLRRINSFKALVFGGNASGIVGYGKGTGTDFPTATDNAIKNLYTNLICINLDVLNTVPVSLRAKFIGHELTLFSNNKMNSWGDIVKSHMIQMSGMRHYAWRLDNR